MLSAWCRTKEGRDVVASDAVDEATMLLMVRPLGRRMLMRSSVEIRRSYRLRQEEETRPIRELRRPARI